MLGPIAITLFRSCTSPRCLSLHPSSCGHLTACMCCVLSVCLTLCSLQPDEALSDDFLFPMTSLRLSYASSPESDLEQGSLPPRLVKCSSDPSIATQEDSQPAPPPYTPPHQYQVRLTIFTDLKCFKHFYKYLVLYQTGYTKIEIQQKK